MKTKKIEDQLRDPILMKRIVDSILDPKNPDSNKIQKEIIKNISNCIVKDDAFLTTVKGMVIENAESVSNQIVTKCLNDSKEYLTNAMVSIVNMRCEEYLKEQKRVITNIIKKTIDNCVEDIIKTTKQNIDKNSKKLSKLNFNDTDCSDSISVPSKYKKQVEDYVDFLSSKDKK